MIGNIRRMLQARGIHFQENYALRFHTTYQVGGIAELAVFPSSLRDLIVTATMCRRNHVRFYVLGGGANVIIADDGLPGVTILTCRLDRVRLKGSFVEAECGVSLEQLAEFAAEKGISGFSFLYDIPGSVGGSLIMNAGNNHGVMEEICERITVLDRDSRLRDYRRNEARFGYRSSNFKETGGLILYARFDGTHRGCSSDLRLLNEQLRRERWLKFPMEFPNGGSVFKRPAGDYAGRLIEACGCGGMRVGDAAVSGKHHGFIVNMGRATAGDIRTLIHQVQERVQLQTGVLLEREQIFLPEDMDGRS